MKVREVKIAGVTLGGSRPLVLIAGPCVIESEKAARRHAENIRKICAAVGVPLIFKASYDKANRSSARSFRGPGLREGLRILGKIREECGVPVLSDVHSVAEVEAAGEVLDCLQIPAFLCRQTDLLAAAARTGKPVNVKKGQFLAPWDMKGAVAKIERNGNKDILLTERGTFFGYNNLVVDFRGLDLMRGLGCPVVFDATHSVQLPGAEGTCSGGESRYAVALARAAVAFGCDGLFLEVHERPQSAPCDGANMITLEELRRALPALKALDRSARKNKVR